MTSRTETRSSQTLSPESEQDPEKEEKKQRKKSWWERVQELWMKTGLDTPTLIMMAKGGLAPTIAVSMIQADSVAAQYTTLGYLVPIVSILSLPILPRAKFIQGIILDIFAICFAAAFSLLMIWTGVQARLHTEKTTQAGGAPSQGSQTVSYNSSASAVCGIWLFFQIYMMNAFRAKFPQFNISAILYSLFVNIAATYGPRFATMTQGVAFARRLLEAFLTGFAIATGVSLFVYPVTSRKIVFKEMTGYINGMRRALKAHADYFQSIEHQDMFGRVETYDNRTEKTGKHGEKLYRPEADAINTAVRAIISMHGKLQGDLTFAKREIALGHLGPDDLQELSKHLRKTMVPIVGLSSVVDIFERLSEVNKWNAPLDGSEDIHSDAVRQMVVREWNDIMQAVHDPFASMIEVMDEGLQHVLYTLQLAKPPRKVSKGNGDSGEDLEAVAAGPKPGDAGFTDYMAQKSQAIHSGKQVVLRAWCHEKGIELPEGFFDHPSEEIEMPEEFKGKGAQRERNQRQLYLLLYMEYLLYATSQAIVDFARFADCKKWKMARKRLIVPGFKRLWKWVLTFLEMEDGEQEGNLGDFKAQALQLDLGEAYRVRKDPEHLPPTTFIEKAGNVVRLLPAFFRSPYSSFGFRVACATMCIAIISFLHDTQIFFVKQRLVWAMIMIAISMSPTTGQSVFGFFLRLVGTLSAVVASFLVWYIPDEKTPGVIVLLFLFASAGCYVPLKMPRFVISGVISLVTLTMITGYELEVRKIGKAVAESNGQPYYPVYLLAPYRLATVACGLAVAFIWTIFPYPISEHSVLRERLGASLYLCANYYSIVHETVSARIRGDEGDMTLKTSAGRRLEKARNKVFAKQMLLLNSLRAISDFQKWEVPVGGKFPKDLYDTIIQCNQNIVNYINLVGYASETFSRLGQNADETSRTWLNDFKKLIRGAHLTSHEITSLLALLSASITNGQPLPPYLRTPRPYGMSRRLEAMDRDILSIRHIAEPGYAAFAVLQISTRCIIGDLDKLLRAVRTLVGELDFSFHLVPAAQSTPSAANSRTHLGLVSAAATPRPSTSDGRDLGALRGDSSTGLGSGREKHD